MLPDLANPSIIPLGAVLGGFFGATIARLERADAERTRELVEYGVYRGVLMALLLYVIALAANL